MDWQGKTTIITGGASGIGAALARRLAGEGAHVVIGDLDDAAAEAVAREVGGLARRCDVSQEAEIRELVRSAEERFGPVDVFVSNAGLGRGQPGHAASASDADWAANWQVHVMAHVHAARAVLPGMIERGSGRLINVASAAGLLNQIGDAAYSATKHAAVSFAESLAITHRADGIAVHAVCPQYVATPLIGLQPKDADPDRALLSPDAVAEAIVQGVAEDRFLILPHPQVAQYFALRATDHARWLSGMERLRQKAKAELGGIRPEEIHKIV